MAQRKQAYLAGAIQKAESVQRAAWHDFGTRLLVKLGYQVFNPYEKQGISLSDLDHYKKHDYPTFKNKMRSIINHDLSELTRSSILLCCLDPAALSGAGTIGEVTYAFARGIPVYAFLNLTGGIHAVPHWLAGCLTNFSNSLEGLENIIPKRDLIDQYSDTWGETFCDI